LKKGKKNKQIMVIRGRMRESQLVLS